MDHWSPLPYDGSYGRNRFAARTDQVRPNKPKGLSNKYSAPFLGFGSSTARQAANVLDGRPHGRISMRDYSKPAEAELPGPRVVEVRDLEQERVGRIFPCLNERHYTGCIGYDACSVLCWTPRQEERKALVVVGRAVEAVPCQDCFWARPVQGAVALLNGGQESLMECRLGFWRGRTTLPDFIQNKIALNVRLPCPGFSQVNEDPDEEDLPALPYKHRVQTHEENEEMSIERGEMEQNLTAHVSPAPGDQRRIENRRRVREFLRVTPREETHNRLTLLRSEERRGGEEWRSR